MKVLLIPDAFKDCLSAEEVAAAMERAVHECYPSAAIWKIAASDGGEGFLEAVASVVKDATLVCCSTCDPLGRPLEAPYLLDKPNHTAYIELARASGLELLTEKERDPSQTSTYGTGLQIAHAVDQGARFIYVGLGGSATNDGGVGMAAALGYVFLDKTGQEITLSGGALGQIDRIVATSAMPDVKFYAVNDVNNPLLGPQGAAYTYAPQKGARAKDIPILNMGLENLAKRCLKDLGKDLADIPGAGAAGGTAFGLRTFFSARFIPGLSFVLELYGFSALVREEGIDLIITGEGTIDQQTAFGKTVSGVAREAARFKVPVLAVCGRLELDRPGIRELGLAAAAQLFAPEQPAGYSFKHASRLIYQRTVELLRSTDDYSKMSEDVNS